MERDLLRRIGPTARLSAAFVGLYAGQLVWLAWRTGVTYDEPPHIAASYVYPHTGYFFFLREHPPLTDYIRALPLSLLDLALPRAPGGAEVVVSPHEFGQHFLFRNHVPARTIVRAARLSSIMLALFLAAVLWLWAGQSGVIAATAALFWLTFEPNGLAHGSLATTDIGAAAFILAALAAWTRFLEKGSPWHMAAGIFAGAAACSKATGLGLLPAFVMALLWMRIRGRDRLIAGLRSDAKRFAVMLVCAGAVIVAVYWPAKPASFFEMIAYRARQMREPMPVWFFGRPYAQGHAFYYAGVLAVKTSIPLMALALYAVFSRPIRQQSRAARRVAICAAAVILIAAFCGKRQLGVRYILPVYPLLCLLAGLGSARLWARGRWSRILLVCAGVWHAASAWTTLPHPLAYANEFFGGPKRTYQLLGDSNLDWGQNLPELARFLEQNPGELILSYFGTDCPQTYGLAFQDVFSTAGPCMGPRGKISPGSRPVWLAVSATKRQGFYEPGEPVWAWLQDRKPRAVLGYSLFVYDMTHDGDARKRIEKMYESGSSLPGPRQ